MRATEFLSQDETPRIKIGGSEAAAKAKAWIEKVYAKYPQTFQNNHVMPLSGAGEAQQFAMFELVPSFSKRGAVEVKWFQAYPLRAGVGSRAMKELQNLAQEDGISLTLFPWDKGQVSQSKLSKFYRGQGFTPAIKGGKGMQWEPVTEAKVPPIRDQIIADVRKHGGNANEYFVRFTDVDRVGFSDRQHFKRHLDVDNPKFTITGIGDQGGRRALWFYPLSEYLKQSAQGQYAMDMPYVWLVKIQPDAWLQPVGHDDKRVVQPAPPGKQRVGLLKGGLLPQGVFFEPAFDIIGRYYNYPGQHQRHGEVKGAPEPTWFDRVRGNT